jgi:Tfp pilus assembly protein PilN
MQALQSRPLDINILPERYRPRRITTPMIAGIVAVASVLLGLVFGYSALTAARAKTADLDARLSQVKATLARTQSERAQLEEQLGEVGQQIEQAQVLIARLRTESSTLSQQRAPRSEGIAAVVTALVPRVYIATVVQEGNTIILTGQAGSQGLVLDYARALQASGQFANVLILSMVNTDPLGLAPEVEFSIQVEQ